MYRKKYYMVLFNYNFLFNYILKELLGIFKKKLSMKTIII